MTDKNAKKSEISEAAREEKKRYYREYRAKNKEKIKEYQNNYWNRKAKGE